MSTSCPTCGKAIDPLRAPVARIAAGRVVSYCSAECADQLPRAAAPISLPAPATGPVSTTAVAIRTAASAASPGAPAAVDYDHDPDGPRTVHDLRRRRNRRVLWLSVGIVVGGMAFAVIQAVSPSSPGPVSAERDHGGGQDVREAIDDATPPPVVVVPDPLTPSSVNSRAVAELRTLLTSASTRVAREAARALSRTGDAEALEVLAKALAAETSEIARLEVAYAMARGGDPRGAKVLTGYLKASRRDVKADAGRYLALLGDPRGVPVLEDMLGLSQLRLGASEALSRLGHKGALAALEFVRRSEKSTREDRLRALVALGRAGRADVAEELRGVLGDGQFNVGAAEALARLGDREAAPVLAQQLEVSSLQVGAALGLRRLDAALDSTPYLPVLVAAFDSGKDTAKVTAAEAILVLTGPAKIAERD